MLVNFKRNWFSPNGELFYASRNPNVVGDEFDRSVLPDDCVIIDGPDRPKPDTTKPDVVGLHPDLVRGIGAALADATTRDQVKQLVQQHEDEAAALDAASKQDPILTPEQQAQVANDAAKEADAAKNAEEVKAKAAADAKAKADEAAAKEKQNASVKAAVNTTSTKQ